MTDVEAVKAGRLISVDWEDAASCARWMRPEDAADFANESFIANSVGIEIFRDDKALVLAGQVNSEGWFGNLIRIPLSLIREEWVLARTEK